MVLGGIRRGNADWRIVYERARCLVRSKRAFRDFESERYLETFVFF